VIKSLGEIDELGRRYAEGQDQDALLELCRAFHPYLMKYLVMVCRGHLPIYGVNQHGYRVNRDVEQFIRYFMPRGESFTAASMGRSARHFHLAFKDKDADEIHDIFMELFIAAANKYDPNYTEKVRLVVGVIDGKLRKRKRFVVADVNRYLDIDSNKYVRMLCRRGFLIPVKEREDGPVAGFERSAIWPPPAGIFGRGAIGVAYYLQNNFRYYLQDWITQHMRELESQERVYSLEGWNETRHLDSGSFGSHELVVQADGDFQNPDAFHLAADVEIRRKPLDFTGRLDRST